MMDINPIHQHHTQTRPQVSARSPLSSSVFAMAMNDYLARHGTQTVCTTAPKMYVPCDFLLSSSPPPEIV
jgi:hypothetical protein